MPAAMLVGNLTVLVQLHANNNTNVGLAIKDLTTSTLGILVVLLFALILATIVTQAFEFEVIRALEGYFDALRGPMPWFAKRRIRRHVRKRDHIEKEYQDALVAAFQQARTAMLRIPGAYSQAQLDIVERQLPGIQRPEEVAPERAPCSFCRLAAGCRSPQPGRRKFRQQLAALSRFRCARRLDDYGEVQDPEQVNWRAHLDAETLYKLDALDARLGAYPAPHRVLPTRLGNVLRAAEDRLVLELDENLEGYVLRHYDAIPELLRNEHHDYRTRLEMYTALLLVFVVLAVSSVVLLAGLPPPWASGVVAAVYLVMTWVSYEAGIASARGYSDVLMEIDRHVRCD